MTLCTHLKMHNLSLNFGKTVAFKNVEGEIKKGSLTAIVGPNGGGKTSLVKCMLGHLKPTTGQVQFNSLKQKDLGYMPQKNRLDLSFPITVHEVAGMGLIQKTGLRRAFTTAQIEQIDQTLHKMGICHKKDALLQDLSGGQLQRLLFSRLILQDSPFVILDEPFSYIDQSTKELLLELVKSWQKAGKTILVVMHELDLVQKHFKETLLLAREIVAWGETSFVLNQENAAKAFKTFVAGC